jgi:hypothetical protein
MRLIFAMDYRSEATYAPMNLVAEALDGIVIFSDIVNCPAGYCISALALDAGFAIVTETAITLFT